MQKLWSSILAGEANAPGTYSKRTVNFLCDLDKQDAELFQTLCRFGWVVGGFTPLIFDHRAKIYNDQGLNFSTLTHLDSIGLIQFDPLSGFSLLNLPKKFVVLYCGQSLFLGMEKETDNKLPMGHVFLTKIGEELATVCPVMGVDGFEEYVKVTWAKYIPQEPETERSR